MNCTECNKSKADLQTGDCYCKEKDCLVGQQECQEQTAMERLTIPDEKIEGGWKRAIIDAREVRKYAMTIYWALKKYEDTGLTADEIMELKELHTPKKIKLINSGISVCPECGAQVKRCYTFCKDCGQRLKWED